MLVGFHPCCRAGIAHLIPLFSVVLEIFYAFVLISFKELLPNTNSKIHWPSLVIILDLILPKQPQQLTLSQSGNIFSWFN